MTEAEEVFAAMAGATASVVAILSDGTKHHFADVQFKSPLSTGRVALPDCHFAPSYTCTVINIYADVTFGGESHRVKMPVPRLPLTIRSGEALMFHSVNIDMTHD